MRFNQPASRDVQNGLREVCEDVRRQQKKNVNITWEILSNGVLPC